MKKIVSTLFIVAIVATFARTQSFSVGARTGLNLAKETFYGSSGSSTSLNSRTSFLIGSYATIMFNNNIGIQPELFYSSLGGKANSVVEKLNYISLPIFFRYNANSHVHFLVGPQISMLVAAKDVVAAQPGVGGQTIDQKENFNIPDFSVVPGIGVDFGSFNAGVRYALGMANIAKGLPSGVTLKNNTFQIVVGCKLFGK